MVLGMGVIQEKKDAPNKEKEDQSFLSIKKASARVASTETLKHCYVKAIVTRIQKELPLIESPSSLDTAEEYAISNIILQLSTPQDQLKCEGYGPIHKLQMNAINNILPRLMILEKGDIIEGQLGYHRPNPRGKYLRPEFHNGLHIQRVWRDDSLLKDWSKEYVYYRHIEVVEDAE
jgi:hypothetical protein